MTSSIILVLLLIIIILIILRKPKEEYHSNWAQLLPNFKFSTKDFYELVKKEMSDHKIKGLSFEDVSLSISSVFAGKRLYLRVKWGDYHYDLCFAPFGDGCFVSWWLIFKTPPLEEFLTKVFFLGGWTRRIFFRKTYYQIDTASMFMTYAHHSVLTVVDEITKDTGIRLSETERKPILKNILDR